MTDVTLAAVIGAHGITGDVRLKLFCRSIESLRGYSSFTTGGRTLTLKSLRPDKAGAVAHFAEVTDRNAAEAMRGTVLSVPRASLPPLAEGEYYHADIIGMAVVSTAGEPVGTVAGIENYGAGDVLDIALPGGKSVMVAFRAPAVPSVGDVVIVDVEWLI